MGFLYYAYGSNLLKQRLLHGHNKTMEPIRKGAGRLENYQLRFKGFSSNGWKGHPATIDKCPGTRVWGVVWEIHDADRPALDIQEGNYCPIVVTVCLETGETVECLTYQMRDELVKDACGKPSPHYLDIIKRGAEQNGLPQTYLDYLRKVEHNNYEGVVDVYDQVIKTLADE